MIINIIKVLIGIFALIGFCEAVSWVVDYIANKNDKL